MQIRDVQRSGERESQRRDEYAPHSEVIDADKRVGAVADPADGRESTSRAKYAEHGDGDGGEALRAGGNGEGGVVGGGGGVGRKIDRRRRRSGEEGRWARDEDYAEEGDEGRELGSAREGLVQEEVASVGGDGRGEEGHYYGVCDGEVLQGV